MEPVLDDSVAKFFEEKNLISQIFNNERRISTTLLSPPATRSVSGSSTSSGEAVANRVTPASFSALKAGLDETELVLPAYLDTVETFKWLGFNQQTAGTLVGRFALFEDLVYGGVDAMEIAALHVRGVTKIIPEDAQDDWVRYLTELGIDQDLKSAILDPEYNEIRLTRNCLFWVLEFIRGRWDGLVGLNSNLDKTAIEIRNRAAKEQRHRHERAETILTVGKDAADDDGIPTVATEIGAPLRLDGHLMIYKAGLTSKISNGYKADTGRLELGILGSCLGDFGYERLAYFTMQMEVADKFASYYRRSQPLDTVSILQIAVPIAFLESLKTIQLPFGEVWKEITWNSRKGNDLSRMKHLNRYLSADMWTGHICHSHKAVSKIERWQDMKEEMLLRVPIDGAEVKATQLVVRKGEAILKMQEKCHGKGFIHTLGAFGRHKVAVKNSEQ